MAALIGYGANAVYPYLVYETIEHLAAEDRRFSGYTAQHLRTNFAALSIETTSAVRQFLAMAQILHHIDADAPPDADANAGAEGEAAGEDEAGENPAVRSKMFYQRRYFRRQALIVWSCVYPLILQFC